MVDFHLSLEEDLQQEVKSLAAPSWQEPEAGKFVDFNQDSPVEISMDILGSHWLAMICHDQPVHF